MQYVKKSFVVSAPGTSTYADNWEHTFRSGGEEMRDDRNGIVTNYLNGEVKLTLNKKDFVFHVYPKTYVEAIRAGKVEMDLGMVDRFSEELKGCLEAVGFDLLHTMHKT